MGENVKNKGLYIARLETFDMGELGIRLSNGNFIVPEIEFMGKSSAAMNAIEIEEGN